MPPPCGVCGELMTEKTVLLCEKPHIGKGAKIGSAVQSCPIAKGAIWVHVADEKGKGIPKFPVSNPGPGDAKPTNTDGFSPFDPLDEGTGYSVTIGPIPKDLEDTYFPPTNVSAFTADNIPVVKGEITSVEFRLEKMASLKVTVREKDQEVFVPNVEVTLTGPSPETAVDPAQRTTPGTGVVTFPKLHRAPGYKATIVLKDEAVKKYAIDGEDHQSSDVDPYKTNELTFRLILMTWVKLQVRDKEADAIVDEEPRKKAQPVAKVKVKNLEAVEEEKPAKGGADIAEFTMKKLAGTCVLEQVETEGEEWFEFVGVSEA